MGWDTINVAFCMSGFGLESVAAPSSSWETGAGDDEGGRDVEPFFLELVRGEDVDGEIGDEEDVPELQSGFFCFTVVV